MEFEPEADERRELTYIPSGGLETGAVAAWLVAAVHVFTGAAFESPAFVALEESVLRWLCGILGMPEDAEGTVVGEDRLRTRQRSCAHASSAAQSREASRTCLLVRTTPC
jgi:hypothetical protein